MARQQKKKDQADCIQFTKRLKIQRYTANEWSFCLRLRVARLGRTQSKICRVWWKKLINMHVLEPFLSEQLILCKLIGGPVGAGAGTTVAFLTGKKDIHLRPETPLTFKLAEPVTIPVKG